MSGNRIPMRLKRLLLFALPVLAGLALLAGLKRNRPDAARTAPAETRVSARIITVAPAAVVPQASGYGTAMPARVWEAVAEVAGKVKVIHPRLKRGALLPAGTVVAEIDPSEYKLQVAQLAAQTEALAAQIDELKTRAELDRAIWETEQQAQRLKERELERQRSLWQQGVIPEAEFERTERDTLAQKLKTQAAARTVELVPAQLRVLEARLAQGQAQLDEARTRLEHTRIATPFEGRVAAVHFEQGQFVSRGQVLAVLDDIALAEVRAQFSVDDLRRVVGGSSATSFLDQARKENLGSGLDIAVRVRHRSGSFATAWEGRFARLGDEADPATRTIEVIVEVPQTYERAQPGVRPPLFKGMHCQVELAGKPLPGRISIPRHAVRADGNVLVLDGDSRLRLRPVRIAWQQGNMAVLDGGIEPGETLVVSDIVPAIEGMLVEPVADEALAARLLAEVIGKGEADD